MNDARHPITQTFPRYHGLALELDRLLTALLGIQLDESTTSAAVSDAVPVLLLQLADLGEVLRLLRGRDEADPCAKELLELTFLARSTLPGHQRELAQLDHGDRWQCLLAVSRIQEEACGLITAMQATLVRAGHLTEEALKHDGVHARDGVLAHRHLAEAYVAAVKGGEPDEAQANLRLRRVANALTLLLSKASHALRLEDLHVLRGLRTSIVDALRAGAKVQTLLHLWADAQATLQLIVAMSARKPVAKHDARILQRVKRELDELGEAANVESLLPMLLPLCGRSGQLDALFTNAALPTAAQLRASLVALEMITTPVAPPSRRHAS